MKKFHQLGIVLSLALAFAGRVRGADAPATQPYAAMKAFIEAYERDNGHYPTDGDTQRLWAGVPVQAGATVTVSPKLVKGTYMGVYVAAANSALRAQLKLSPGVGLVVSGMDNDGPAKSAGLRENDVMQKLDDQILINEAQFQVLVRMHKPGDKVEITAIREAQPIKIPVTLVEKEVPDLAWITTPAQVTVTQSQAGGEMRLIRVNPGADGSSSLNGIKMVLPGDSPQGAGPVILWRLNATTKPAAPTTTAP